MVTPCLVRKAFTSHEILVFLRRSASADFGVTSDHRFFQELFICPDYIAL
jgi:hypothetical protein